VGQLANLVTNLQEQVSTMKKRMNWSLRSHADAFIA
jgi:hypothetical protein